MSRTTRYLLLGLILLVGGYLAYWLYAGRLAGFSQTYYLPRYSTAVYALDGNAQISQEFEADYPGLHRIDLFFQHQVDSETASIIFHLKNSCTTEDTLATIEVDYKTIVNNQPQSFSFPPLDNSAGHRYCFIVTSQSPQPPASMGIYSSYVDVYPAGQADYQVNTSAAAETETPTLARPYHIWLPMIQRSSKAVETFDIGFNLYYDGPVETTLQTLLAKLAAHKPFPFGRAGFYIGLTVLYLIVFGLLFRVVSRLNQGPKL
ncbi:MAG: hypothetical protein H6631_02575 [Anaerolineaceae bacterium]|nr:hypothetical protein [Anaerolineaceae bacterium]MCB9101169.1 hypothetical protein [Anaerolineales bacterium]